MQTFHTLFFVRRFPSAWYFRDTDYFMAEVNSALRQTMFDLLRSFGSEKDFFKEDGQMLVAVAIRARNDTESDALASARDSVDGILDALSLMAYNGQSEVSKITLVASPDAEKARIVLFAPEAFFEFGATPPKTEPAADSRADEITSMLIPLIDLAADNHFQNRSDLAEQLAYALKMFRHGSSAGAYAIEFICKFTAMESLVCGGEKRNKRDNLLERLPRLFPGDAKLTPAYFEKLWETRNFAVHEARGFHIQQSTKATEVQQHLEDLNRIVLTVVTYAVAHLDKADSVQALWSQPQGYCPPEFTKSFLPQTPGVSRVGAKRLIMELQLSVPNSRTLFEPFT